MTQEEIIEKAKKVCFSSNPQDYIQFVGELAELKPDQLPDNLDDAAKKIAYEVCKDLPPSEEKDSIVYYAILAAIEGAKWAQRKGGEI